jgi:hypothetical protein
VRVRNVDLVVHDLFVSSLISDAERFDGSLHILQDQRLLEGGVVRRVDEVQVLIAHRCWHSALWIEMAAARISLLSSAGAAP